MDLLVRRIKSKFDDIICEAVDMTDCDSSNQEKYESQKLSRALAAYALVIECGIEIDVAVSSIVDGYKDYAIDAIYKDEIGKRLVLVQAKWSNDGNGTISQGDTLKFCEGIEYLLNLDFSDCNQKILNKKTEIETCINELDYQIHLVVIYTSNNPLPTDSSSAIEKLKNNINDEVTTLVTSNTITKSDIVSRLLNSVGLKEIDIDDILLHNWGPITENDSIKGYYGIVNASSIAEWWYTHGNAILAKNIRYFKGDTEVNKGIETTLLSNPEKFIYYNNGIKILVKKPTRKLVGSTTRESGLFSLSGVSIINGAQTVGSIGAANIKSPEKVARANVFVQIISLEDADDQFSYSVTKLSNTQNKIENKSFASLDPIQEKIRLDLLLDGYNYSYKDGTTPNSENSITIDDIAVSVGCCCDDINVSTSIKSGYGSLFEDIGKPPYKTIFNTSLTSYFIINCYKIFKLFEAEHLKYKSLSTGANRLVSIHGNRFLLHLVFQTLKMNGYKLREQIYNFEANTIQMLIEKYVEDIISVKNEVYKDAYPANIFKNAKRCRSIAEKLTIVDLS